ncbi:AAA family ATPase [Enhygromyxa salina]|nr:AAA family ATPase [Enhygromyxa salina]
MSDARRFWQETHHCFDPSEPVTIDQSWLHAERDPRYNPIAQIERQLRHVSQDRSRFLLTGAVGNGKTSELNHFASKLTQSRIVVLVDLWEHVQNNVRDQNALDRLEMWELLGLIGVAIYRAGEDSLGHQWKDEPKLLQRALESLRAAEGNGDGAEIDLVKLARGMTVAAGGVMGAVLGGPVGAAAGAAIGETATEGGTALVKAVADSSRWTWKVGLPGTRPRGDQDGELRQVLNAVNRLIMSLQHSYARPLLVVIDGLDRIRDEERTRALFIDSLMLSELDCDALITAPVMLMRRQGQSVDHFIVKDLNNIPVLDRDAPASPGPGLAFFRDLVARRVAWIGETLASAGLTPPPAPFPVEIVDQLAYYSGGLAREFINLVRLAAIESLDRGVEQLDRDVLQRTLREARTHREYYMTKAEIELLERVMRDPDRELPGDELALTLLQQRRLLAYPNETTWYYPHPLLTLALLKPERGSKK